MKILKYEIKIETKIDVGNVKDLSRSIEAVIEAIFEPEKIEIEIEKKSI